MKSEHDSQLKAQGTLRWTVSTTTTNDQGVRVTRTFFFARGGKEEEKKNSNCICAG
jgi:hypothetical protein